mmetsp:Transcript_26780/g.31451  ORF Transcript_26780/g.31451 Transcript_26780/m.31451 type:complete len:265 (-) Transcript_26780:212-1006(-)
MIFLKKSERTTYLDDDDDARMSLWGCCSVGGGLRGLHLDTTHASTVDDSKADVSILTPGGTPGVLDLVVGGTVGVRAVAHSEDAVVELGTAIGSDDAAAVPLEDLLVGLDGDRDGALRDGGLQSLRVLGGHIDVASDGNFGLGAVVAAALEDAPALVGVVGLGLERVRLSPLEGAVHHATHAAEVAVVGAIDELLLREGEKLTGGEEVGTFHGASGREGPAGAARALVLDCSHGAGSNPVDLSLVGGLVVEDAALTERSESAEA